MIALVAAGARPAYGADEVLSGNIREADNKSGQNTNTGSGIKTNHIQNDAVTTKKIKDGTVATADLANNAVTSAKIKDGNVLAADLAESAVTPAKISFFGRVIIVDAAGGGDFTSPVAALEAITDASPMHPYLVKVLPGFYDVGVIGVQMKPFVDLEGSGEGITLITGMVPAFSWPPTTALVVGASNSEVRSLTLDNFTMSFATVGFISPAGAAPTLRQVTVRTSGITHTIGIYNAAGSAPRIERTVVQALSGAVVRGIVSEGASPVIEDVSVRAEQGSDSVVAVENVDGAAVLRRVTATATGIGADGVIGAVGVFNDGGAPTLESVRAKAATSSFRNAAIWNRNAQPELRLVDAEGLGVVAHGMLNSSDAGLAMSYVIHADRSTFKGTTNSVLSDLEFGLLLGAARLEGGLAAAGGGFLSCVSSYAFFNGQFRTLDGNCSPL